MRCEQELSEPVLKDRRYAKPKACLPGSRDECGKVEADERLCGEWRKAEHLGCQNKKIIFHQLPVRSLVTIEEFMTSGG